MLVNEQVNGLYISISEKIETSTAAQCLKFMEVSWGILPGDEGGEVSHLRELLATQNFDKFIQLVTKSANRQIGKLTNSKYINISICLLYTSPSPRDRTRSRMPSSA